MSFVGHEYTTAFGRLIYDRERRLLYRGHNGDLGEMADRQQSTPKFGR